MTEPNPKSRLDHFIWFCLTNKLVVFLGVLFVVVWGVVNAPFDIGNLPLPRDPVPVDAIPDIGENQQIVYTEWMGRSPRDIEDQITYPLTTSLMGIPDVRTVRSYSFFGFSTIYVIFEEGADYYWARSRILEKLNSLSGGTLPAEVRPTLGPDATALGQVFWYTLEGRDEKGRPTGGWDLHELRSIQDWYVRYALLAADGVSEVASVGGHIREYQVDVDPDAMRAYGVTLNEVFQALKMSNKDVGARNIEIHNVEYFIRGLGFVADKEDLEFAVVKTRNHVPVYVKDVGRVTLGPAQRRGLLDKGGAEVVGGVVVARNGANPLKVIESVKEKIALLEPGLASKTLPDGTVSKLTVVPFYDRSGLIFETLGTLKTALSHEILVTIIVILVMLMNLRSSFMVAGLLPLSVLMTFVAMRRFGVDANIVALSGIAIAIGTMVDMGIVIVENILKHLEKAPPDEPRLTTIYRGASEVGGAVLAAVATTVISFLPVFFMEAAEGKLFRPLAYTKTFALAASIIVSLALIPPLAHLFFRRRKAARADTVPKGRQRRILTWVVNGLLALYMVYLLTDAWYPLGVQRGMAANYLFTVAVIGVVLGFFQVVQWLYPYILRWAMAHRVLFLMIPSGIVLVGAMIWLGADHVLGKLPERMHQWGAYQALDETFPGLGKEFMPPLDEGSFLFMPTTSVHAAINEAADVLRKQDMGIAQIPEVSGSVGKLGRADTPLDPAPISMIETVVNYHPEFLVDAQGRRTTFAYDADAVGPFRDISGAEVAAPDGLPYQVRGQFARDDAGHLVPDSDGAPFRIWRPALDPDLNEGRAPWPGIRSPDDIWEEITRMSRLPGSTSAPKLQPIAARLVMLQSGMRAPMGVKIKGPDLATIEAVGLEIEKYLKQVPSVAADTVIADRIIGKPYLEFHLDRKAMARYGLKLEEVQAVIESAIGGKQVTTTIEGRERYPVRVRYQRELRDTPGKLKKVLVPTPDGAQIPLSQISDLGYTSGPQVIKSEDTFLTSYVIFDKKDGFAEVDVVEQAKAHLDHLKEEKLFVVPKGVRYEFAGAYENQVRASQRLALVLPLALFLIFLILYFQFKSVSTTMMVFSGILVAWSGGFLMIWCYSRGWFLDLNFFGANLRDLFGVHPINLSVAIWVGFLALFGIATDDGVLIATYLKQQFSETTPGSREEIREMTLTAGLRRVRPALMTSATTVIALIPILTSSGRGSDIMKPMAIPTFGGMMVVTLTIFVVPVLYSLVEEWRLVGRRRAVMTASQDTPD